MMKLLAVSGIILCECMSLLSAQTVPVRGTVTDAVTGNILPFATVMVVPAQMAKGVITDNGGSYAVELDARSEGLMFSFTGYRAVTVKTEDIRNGRLDVQLLPMVHELEATTVTGNRKRYRRKGNPALDIIRSAIARKGKNRIEKHETYQNEIYGKVVLALGELDDSVKTSSLFRQYPFLSNYIDTSETTGALTLPVFIREKIIEHSYRRSPEDHKNIIVASQIANFRRFIENKTISVMMDGLVGKMNIYDSKMTILENEYVSPLSTLAPLFYHFHILDTLMTDGHQCIKLSVYPANEQDFGFSGQLYITNDSMYAVKRVELTFSGKAGVNFVNRFSFVQDYTLIDSTWCLTSEESVFDFSFSKNKNMIKGKSTNIYYNYRFNEDIPAETFDGGNTTEERIGYDMQPEDYWNAHRPVSLSRTEQNIYRLLNEAQDDCKFKYMITLIGIAHSGYLEAGKFDLGPVGAMLSLSDIEGVRLRFGGKTNARFHPRLFLEGYAAYGSGDNRFKYNIGVRYSVNSRKKHPWEFPMNLFSVLYESDIETPGSYFSLSSPEHFLLSFHHGKARQMIYHKTIIAKWDKEYGNGFSFRPSLMHREETPAGSLSFIGINGEIHRIAITQAGLRLRFAPCERFYQIQQYRTPINHIYPVFTANYYCGIKALGGDYNYHRLELSIDKRTWFSSFGFADVWLKSGKIWGAVPFPLLVIHPANQNYAYQDDGYNMMNYLEFVSDRYLQAHISYNFNGWIMNRIPLVRKMKLREIFTFKILWGTLSKENEYGTHPDLFRFLSDGGVSTMYTLTYLPYMEANVGIDNIFKFLRLDLVKRFHYLDHPDVSEWGVRFRIHFSF
ncbi:MAG: DUF5686 and carboxypeptidase regulatory-like domain-containing protein [Bacteroidales bacterium]|jgi:hypothetical protein|nr:DUF5686 and carboxypeptidase regulatory-like domain-containing protein [Bacteroidales bacterium]